VSVEPFEQAVTVLEDNIMDKTLDASRPPEEDASAYKVI
jgi:hypothetical protein